MPNLNDYHVTDGVDDVLASQYNLIVDSVIRGELSNIESLTTNKTLTNADFALQVLSPTAARDVTLPVIAAANHPFYIINVSATYALTVKNSGGSTIGTVAVSSSGSFASDGVTWHSFGGGGGGGGITDGDKGDVTVSGSGATWTIDAGVVTLAKMANMATDSLIGRDTAGTGVPEVLSAATVKTILGVSEADVQTLSNKRITPRVGTATSSATPTINTDSYDFYHLTAQTVDITSFTTNLSGTPTNAQKLWIAVTGTAARAITWGASFEAGAAALPTTTVTTQRLDVGFIWNTVSGKWRCMASGSSA